MLALGLSCFRSAEFQDQQTSSKCKQCLAAVSGSAVTHALMLLHCKALSTFSC